MKTLALVLVPLLVALPTTSAQDIRAQSSLAPDILLCTGLVCDAICDGYNWVGAHPWFDWLASNPWIRLGRSCPIA